MYKDPQELLIILNNCLKQRNIEMTLGFIFGMVESADVYLSENDIKKYLEEEKKKRFKEKDIEKMNFGEQFLYKMELEKYEYIPYTLYFYKKSISILKKKCLMFIKLIESIVDKNISKTELSKYDITVDSNGNILNTDIKRIVEPFVYNLYLLIHKMNEANELETYIKNKINLDYLYRKDMNEYMVYPSEELQPSSLEDIYVDTNGFIPFTTKQEVERENKLIENLNDNIDRTLALIMNEGGLM